MSYTKKTKSIDWLIKNYMPFFKKFGLTEENILNQYEIWKLNRINRIEDYLWYLFNLLLFENVKQSTDLVDLYKRNDEIYNQMLYYRRKIEGKPANEIQKLLNYNRLELKIESTPYEFEVIVNATNDCKVCENLSGKSFSIKEALKDEIIPYKQCTRKQGCACVYSIKLTRDKEGRIIKK